MKAEWGIKAQLIPKIRMAESALSMQVSDDRLLRKQSVEELKIMWQDLYRALVRSGKVRLRTNPGSRQGNLLGQWQHDYDVAVGAGGKVTDVFGRMGRFGGIAIWVEVEEDGDTVYYSPYLNQDPDEDQVEFFDQDSEAWLDSMTGATNWDEWSWGAPTRRILDH